MSQSNRRVHARMLSAMGAALLLGGCAPAMGPAAPAMPAKAVQQDAADASLAAGTLSGLIAAFDGQRFVPVAGASVSVGGHTVETGPDGRYTLVGLSPGDHGVRVAKPGYQASSLRATLSPVMGTARVNALLGTPRYAVQAIAPFPASVSGVVTDPRGAALPNATVHVLSNAAYQGAGSNAFVSADMNGFYTAILPAVAVSETSPGVVQIAASGVTPGGIRVETSKLFSDAIKGASLVLNCQTDAFQAPGAAAINGAAFVMPGEIASATATGLSNRPDEFYLQITSGGQTYVVLPLAVSNGNVSFRVPYTLPSSTFQLSIAPFGKAPVAPTGPVFSSAYAQVDFDADLSYSVASALVEHAPVNPGFNDAIFVGGDEATFSLTLANADSTVAQDIRLEGTVPVGSTIVSASANGVTLNPGMITQPDTAGKWAISGFNVPTGGTCPITVRFASPIGMANGAAFQVSSLAVKMPSTGLTKTVPPAASPALLAKNLDRAGATLVKTFEDDATAANGVGKVRLVLTPGGPGALGAFTVSDMTMTDQLTAASAPTFTGTATLAAASTPLGLTAADHLDLQVDGGATVAVQVFSSVYDAETLIGQINSTQGLQGLITASRTATGRLEIARTVQGATRTLEIMASSSGAMLTTLGLTPGRLVGSDGILADFSTATARQTNGTVWTLTPRVNKQNINGALAVTFTLTPPAAYATGDSASTPLTVVYEVSKTGGGTMTLGGPGGTGASFVGLNLVAPFLDSSKEQQISIGATEPAAISGL